MSVTALEVLQPVVRVLLAAAFVGMGVAHFRSGPRRTMEKLIPPRLRFSAPLDPKNLVLFTGVCEIAGGIGILVPATRVAAAIGLVLLLIAVFPANAYAAEHPERFGTLAIPFWPRYWAQLALIAAILLTSVPLS